MKKKILSSLLAVAMCASLFAACAPKDDTKGNAETTTAATTTVADTTAKEESSEFVIEYPSYMKENYGENVTLEKKPEKVICLSNSVLQIMIRCDMKPIAVQKPSKSIEFPDWVHELPVITAGMSDLDIETIVSMEPDLVVMGGHFKEDFGGQLEAAGIPAYYTAAGPSTTYNEVKEESIVLTRSFGSEEKAKEVEAEFAAVEKRMADFKASTKSQKAMILFGAPPSYQQTSKGYLGSILAQLPYENMSDTLIDPEQRTAPLDLEKLVTVNPEIIFAISPTAPTGEVIKGIYEEEFGKNPQIWKELQAVKNNKIIYLSNEYVTAKGIQIIKSINKLIDMLGGENSNEADTNKDNASAEKVVIPYPADMQAQGFKDPVVLDKMPEKVAVVTKAPVLALYELGVNMIAVPKAGVSKWPADLDAKTTKLDSTMNKNFDIETVIALEPDLVILTSNSADTYGKVLKDAGIPVYYIFAGHTVPYSSVRSQTEALVEGFGKDSAKGKEIIARFDALEKKIDSVKKNYTGKNVMVLQSAPPSHYIQTSKGTLASMAEMLGFGNVYKNDKSSMAPLDMEQAISYNPDLVLCVGGTPDSAMHKKAMEEDFAKNADYWNSIPAVKDGKVLYFSANFVANTGIGFLDNMEEFVDMLEDFYKE